MLTVYAVLRITESY